MATTKAYGLDLAGYSTKGSALAEAERNGESITVTILRGNVFANQAVGTDNLVTVSDPEVNELKRLMKEAHVYVDVPIDLQDLPAPKDATKVADLTKRPIDQALGALPPLADKIGSYVARMQHLRRRLTADLGEDPLGKTLFETYPAASLRQSGRNSEGYKGTVVFVNGKWAGEPAEGEAEQKKNNKLADLLNALKWTASAGLKLIQDEFDAALCAITGVGHCIEGESLAQKYPTTGGILPNGYALLASIPMGVFVQAED